MLTQVCLVYIILYTHSIYEFCFQFTAGLEFAVETLKSFILSMALMDNHLTVETAVHLSRLELEFQVQHVVYCFVKMDFTLPALHIFFNICNLLLSACVYKYLVTLL